MASIRSLGVHVPVALPYLIAEGVLQPDAKPESYQWTTYVNRTELGDVEEQVLATKDTVVWSQGHFIRNIYRFRLEGEDVRQATLTTFPSSSGPRHGSHAKSSAQGMQTNHPRSQHQVVNSTHGTDAHARAKEPCRPGRALVVVLRTKAHIYFLEGASYIVDLPFEVAKIFPAPRGIVLQRQLSSRSNRNATPLVPAVPPNSFFSSQARSSLSYLQSPTLAKSFANSQPTRPSPLGGNVRLESLFSDVMLPKQDGADDDITNIYSLSGPLHDFGVVTFASQRPKPRIHGKSQPGTAIEFEGLDPAEIILYISSTDELSALGNAEVLSLTLLVTQNHDLGLITLWHAWYLDAHSLTMLLKQRAEQKAVKARRRSSFLSAGLTTGAATPAVRHREGGRESFAAPGTLRPPGEQHASQNTAVSVRKPTRQEEEEAMASQMDPDYQKTAPGQPVRESRRISSMNTDVRASQHTVNASFAATGNRRATSFGGHIERRSLGHRKSRGSTPGSMYSRSIGPDDDSMDLDSTTEIDNEEAIESIVRHVRATFESSGIDSVFGSSEEGFKRELVVRRVHSIPVMTSIASQEGQDSVEERYKVLTFVEPRSNVDTESTALAIYIHDHSTGDVQTVDLQLRMRSLWPEMQGSPKVPIPLLAGTRSGPKCHDLVKIQDGGSEAVVVGRSGLAFSPNGSILPMPGIDSYRMYSQNEILTDFTSIDKDIGRNRVLLQAPDLSMLAHAGNYGSFDEVGRDGVHHRRQLKTGPHLPMIQTLLEVFEFVLGDPLRQTLRRNWCAAYVALSSRADKMASTASDIEFVALVATIFTFAVPLLGSKCRAALKLASVAAARAKSPVAGAARLRRLQHQERLLAAPAWSALPLGIQSPKLRSPKTRDARKDNLLPLATGVADEICSTAYQQETPRPSTLDTFTHVSKLMMSLHIFREECKLNTLVAGQGVLHELAVVIAQLGSWLGFEEWSVSKYDCFAHESVLQDRWLVVQPDSVKPSSNPWMDTPATVFEWYERSVQCQSTESFPSLLAIFQLGTPPQKTEDQARRAVSKRLTPRISALSDLVLGTSGFTSEPVATVELLAKLNFNTEMLDTLPESIAAPFKDSISQCEKQPPTMWQRELLELVGRTDLIGSDDIAQSVAKPALNVAQSTTHDVQSICLASDAHLTATKTREASRHEVSQLIFSEDRRLVEAVSLMHFNNTQVVECPKQPEWDDAMHLDQQRRIMHHVTTRMIALPAGDGMIHYDSQIPLLTERYHLPGFSSSCLIQPMGHTLTTDRSGLTEEKVNWAYFHAGVAAGLRVSRNAKGIDTSWVAFNKPNDLTNRHAGLLLALGLGGHLRHLAKWLSFKYLTPKHTMTSVGLLLGLSASYLGTMDSLVTRMLSVHITRMLPPGASELNVSPATQTAGLMGIGLLYYNTQHRRMSEIMLSEIEYMEIEDPDSGPDLLRDESYRLAAGFALGLINLGRGSDLHGLHGMHLPERLLAMAVGPRPVNAVHVFDRATAGAVIAIALVYIKTGDRAVARKIDIPDTEAQFDHVRPDILLLRAMTKHIILWDSIQVQKPSDGRSTSDWINENCPACYKKRPLSDVIFEMITRRAIDSSHIPLFNIHTGLAWALGLKYAGSGNVAARDEILTLLGAFHILNEGVEAFYFDGKLGRASLRRCMDVLAISAAMVMAGTGDLVTFRYLRRMHGRVDGDTPYGSHLAAHMAIGVLFLGGGTFTLGTSDLAIATLICAFYPLFPNDVHDNRVHLQAFRHLWVLAAEGRCLIAEDIDTQRPIHMPIKITRRDKTIITMRSPCLLPDLATIATVETADPAYWRVTLDFENNPDHMNAFRLNQRVLVRRCPAAEAHSSVFSAALSALNDAQSTRAAGQIWHTIFTLKAFREFDKADIELILPPDAISSRYSDEKITSIDDRLVLSRASHSNNSDALWNLRMLFAWAEHARDKGDGKLAWLGHEAVERLRASIEDRAAAIAAADETQM